ncbi:MAG: UDP-N-acetylmuramoyl-L-alanyl-D-glutamate--2,6-diaminopimelate ligase [Pseudomonadota bacterium]
MKLSDLVEGLFTPPPGHAGDEIVGLTEDSRAVEPGFLFAGLPGTARDGAEFVPAALDKGASAVLAHPAAEGVQRLARKTSIPIFISDRPRQDFARLAARLYGPQPTHIAAVTGTNGKTSTAGFLRQIFEFAGTRAASIGTLGVITGEGSEPLRHTTPDPVTLHRALRGLKRRGIDHVALEASSHGLAQGRLDGAVIRAAAFLNLSRDHLDYHATEEAYFLAKSRLLLELLSVDGLAVLNHDSPYYERLRHFCDARGVAQRSFGTDPAADLRLVSQVPTPSGQRLALLVDGTPYEVDLPLIGSFQAENVLAAAGLASGCGLDWPQIVAALPNLAGIPGRLEAVRHPDWPHTAYVDYAHTPDALERALAAVRPHVEGRLLCVIGCGGDRDPGKRAAMGHIAARDAEFVVITDDNPRSEDPAAIRAAMLEGAQSGPGEVAEIGDRRAAIARALTAWKPGDVVLVAGKGHETGQQIGDQVFPFVDRQVILETLAAGGHRQGGVND